MKASKRHADKPNSSFHAQLNAIDNPRGDAEQRAHHDLHLLVQVTRVLDADAVHQLSGIEAVDALHRDTDNNDPRRTPRRGRSSMVGRNTACPAARRQDSKGGKRNRSPPPIPMHNTHHARGQDPSPSSEFHRGHDGRSPTSEEAY